MSRAAHPPIKVAKCRAEALDRAINVPRHDLALPATNTDGCDVSKAVKVGAVLALVRRAGVQPKLLTPEQRLLERGGSSVDVVRHAAEVLLQYEKRGEGRWLGGGERHTPDVLVLGGRKDGGQAGEEGREGGVGGQ